MIDLNREEFEKLPEIAESIKDKEVYFDEKEGCYIATDVDFYYDAGYANGAWYAFQEQQKKLDCCREENKAHLEKIDELQARVDESLEYLNNLSWASELDVENVTNILKGNKDEN